MNYLERVTITLSPSRRDALRGRLRHFAQELDDASSTLAELRIRWTRVMLAAERSEEKSSGIAVDPVAEEFVQIVTKLVSADKHRTAIEYRIAVLAIFLNDGSFDTLDIFFLLEEVYGEDFMPWMAIDAIQEVIALHGADVLGNARHPTPAK